MTRRTSQRGKSSSEREIHPTVFFAFSAVPLTYSGKSMASPSSLAPLAQGSFSGRWALWKTAPAARPLEPPARFRYEIFTPTELFNQIAGSPQAARELFSA